MFRGDWIEHHAASFLHTIMTAIGGILVVHFWNNAINRDDFFRMSRKPFVVGIAGDSGSGKDTLASSIAGLFGDHSVVKISGDDYHLWDRHRPMWQVMTHLNPMANDLERFCTDLVALCDGKSILSCHYDHLTGKMSRPSRVKSNDFIIASGLHTLYLPMLRSCCALKIYLDINEELRRFFKVKRDVQQRGYSAAHVLNALESREADSDQFIRSQAQHADLVFSLQPTHPHRLCLESQYPVHLKLIARTQHNFNELSLYRVLVGICGLNVDIIVPNDSSEVRISIEGEVAMEDIAFAARLLCPQIFDLLDLKPKWNDGVNGIMQLLTLCHINQFFTKRFIM